MTQLVTILEVKTHNNIFKPKIRANKNCAMTTTTGQKAVTGNSAGLHTGAENVTNMCRSNVTAPAAAGSAASSTST